MDTSTDEHHDPIARRHTAGDGARIGQGGGDLFSFRSNHLNE